MTAIRKPPAPSLEDMVREFLVEHRSYDLDTAYMAGKLLAFVRSIPPINAEAERAEALRVEIDRMEREVSAWREADDARHNLSDGWLDLIRWARRVSAANKADEREVASERKKTTIRETWLKDNTGNFSMMRREYAVKDDALRSLLLDCADLLREHYSDEDVQGDPPQRVPSPALRMETRIRDYLEGR